MKRFLDIFCAAFGLIVLLPLLCPLAILLRMTGEGKVFYRQERMGFGLKPFFILKFATMLENSPSLGSGDITLKNDPRVLPVGRILRKTKINELPQLWNVLIGEMSLVGPRPLTQRQYELYPRQIRIELARVKPGITGLGSLAFRDEEKWLLKENEPQAFYVAKILPRKGALESWYCRNQTVFLDAIIILLTAIIVLAPASTVADRWIKSRTGLSANPHLNDPTH